MKKLLLLFLIIFISSCGLDESFEKHGKADSDDTNIIKKAGDQYINKAIKLYNVNANTYTRAS